jgi:protease II
MIITIGFVMKQDQKRRFVLLFLFLNSVMLTRVYQVINQLKEENKYCEETLSPLNGLKETLYQEMIRYLKESDDEVGGPLTLLFHRS